MTLHTGVRLAEVGFLLIVIAGIWMTFAQQARYKATRSTVAGLALAAAGILLIVATHWGHFGA
jgi:uncharacterized membrane protein